MHQKKRTHFSYFILYQAWSSPYTSRSSHRFERTSRSKASRALKKGFQQELVPWIGQGLSILALLKFWTGWLFVRGGCPVHYKVFCSIPGLYLLETSRTTVPYIPHRCDNQYVSKHCQKSPQALGIRANHWNNSNNLLLLFTKVSFYFCSQLYSSYLY